MTSRGKRPKCKYEDKGKWRGVDMKFRKTKKYRVIYKSLDECKRECKVLCPAAQRIKDKIDRGSLVIYNGIKCKVEEA